MKELPVAAAQAGTQGPGTGGRLCRFVGSTIGRKVIMAVTGLILFGFIVGHMLGNLQIFMGPEKINAYGHFLHEAKGLLWGTRIVLLLSVIAHVGCAFQLALWSDGARPVKYQHALNPRGETSYAARTMKMSGVIILAFVIYHLLHFTTGNAHPDFKEGDVYTNVVVGFRSIPAALAYVVAMGLLATHLMHGIWSMFQTVGLAHRDYSPKLQALSVLIAGFIFVGFVSVPAAVLTNILRP